jgi:hypothetical protein
MENSDAVGYPETATKIDVQSDAFPDAIRLVWSAFGTKRTNRAGLVMSAFRGRAEVAIAPPDFRV